jgi:hypothetical protein
MFTTFSATKLQYLWQITKYFGEKVQTIQNVPTCQRAISIYGF